MAYSNFSPPGKDRARNCIGLMELKDEILGLFPHALDAYGLIGSWRDTLQYGNRFWQNKVPVLLNFICLMIMDEFDAASFNSLVFDLKTTIAWRKNGPRVALDKRDMPYPPDINLI